MKSRMTGSLFPLWYSYLHLACLITYSSRLTTLSHHPTPQTYQNSHHVHHFLWYSEFTRRYLWCCHKCSLFHMSVMVSDVVTEIEEHVPHKLKPMYYYILLFVTIYSFSLCCATTCFSHCHCHDIWLCHLHYVIVEHASISTCWFVFGLLHKEKMIKMSKQW